MHQTNLWEQKILSGLLKKISYRGLCTRQARYCQDYWKGSVPQWSMHSTINKHVYIYSHWKSQEMTKLIIIIGKQPWCGGPCIRLWTVARWFETHKGR